MIDLVKLLLRAGDGGHGRVAFRREKYVPKGGPSGGTGGNGGHVVIRATTHVNTLAHLAGVNKLEAQDGARGQKKQMSGGKGESLVIDVPVGTIIWQLDSNRIARRRVIIDRETKTATFRAPLHRRDVTFKKYHLEIETERIPEAEPDRVESMELLTESLKNVNLDEMEKIQLATLNEDGEELLIAQGGFGGRGNESFKAANQTTPLFAEYGTQAEERLVLFELQLLADVGLVGLPNAGKSTFLSRTTNANPRIDSYPFTTLEPQLGIWALHDGTQTKRDELVVADIPGLIEGASEGQGLGFQFLRHVRACSTLVFVLAPTDDSFGKLQTGEMTAAELITEMEQQYALLKKELKTFDPGLLKKKQVIAFNKIDLLPQDTYEELVKSLKKKKHDWVLISGNSGQGMAELQREILG
jgi:GTPase